MNWNKKIEEEGHYHEWIYKALNGCHFKCFIRRNGGSFNWCGYVEVDAKDQDSAISKAYEQSTWDHFETPEYVRVEEMQNA